MKPALMAGAGILALMSAGEALAQDAPFSEVVVFGDSLSDTGNVATLQNLPTPNSYTTNPGPVTVEVVAENYGLSTTASLLGGTNSAYGGAGYVNNAFGTPAGIPTLAAQVNARLAGGARIDPDALVILFGGGNDVNFAGTSLVIGSMTQAEAEDAMRAAGNQAIDLIDALQGAGAKTIIVVNTPDVGLTPTARSADAINPGSAERISGLANTLNQTLYLGLDRKGVVPVNAFLLLQESAANPAAFGLSNVTDTACTTASSLNCTTSTLKAPDADLTWLFADGIHPTTAGHFALGQLIISELAAPQQISLLAEAPIAVAAAGRAGWSAELADAGDRARIFVHLAGSSADLDPHFDIPASESAGTVLTAGGLWPLNEALTLGAALSLGRTDTDFGSGQGGFDTRSETVSVFGQYGWGTGGHLIADATVGRLSFDDIQRRFALAGGVRSERGQTDGDYRSFGLSGSWWFGDQGVRHGPVAGLRYEEVSVNRYSEAGATSSTMWFEDQSRDSFVGTVGWALRGAVAMDKVTFTPFAEATWNIEMKDDPRLVEAGLVTMPGTFAMPAYLPNDEWVGLRLGTGIDIGRRVGFTAVYQGRLGDQNEDHTVSVGVNFRY